MQADTKENGGLCLLKKGKRGIMHIIFSRVGIMILLLLLQAAFLFSLFYWFEEFLPHILGGTVLFTAGMMLYLLNSRIDPTAKITWLVVVMMIPVFGALLFWYTQSEIGHRALKKRLEEILDATKEKLSQNAQVLERLRQTAPEEAALASYLNRSGNFAVFADTQTVFFPMGEDKFEEMLKQLEEAKQYIFMEFLQRRPPKALKSGLCMTEPVNFPLCLTVIRRSCRSLASSAKCLRLCRPFCLLIIITATTARFW